MDSCLCPCLQRLYRQETDSKNRTRQLGEIKMAIQNIYSRTRQRGPYPDSNKQFLDSIQQRIIDYQAIVSMHDRPQSLFTSSKPRPVTTAHAAPVAHVASEDPASAPRVSIHKNSESQWKGAASMSAAAHVESKLLRPQKCTLDMSCVSQSGSVAGASMAEVDGQGRSVAHPTAAIRALAS